MFTGIVETIGTILEYNEKDNSDGAGGGVSATIGDCSIILVDAHLGDSICTNGVCLTITELDESRSQFKVGIAPETLRRSDLGHLKAGSKVNLERAVNSEVRLGGHVVQGHVDTVAHITKIEPDGNAIAYKFRLRDAQYIPYIVEKGFIAIDGVSLTVTEVDYKTNEFGIMMVSYTQGKVILPMKKIGDSVNIEVDLTGKLIQSQIEQNLARQIENEESPLVKLITSIIDKKLSAMKP